MRTLLFNVLLKSEFSQCLLCVQVCACAWVWCGGPSHISLYTIANTHLKQMENQECLNVLSH